MSRKARDRRRKEREQLRAVAAIAAPDPSSIVSDSAAPISKAEMRERIHELIESGEVLGPPPPNSYRSVQFRNAIGEGIRAGMSAAVPSPK